LAVSPEPKQRSLQRPAREAVRSGRQGSNASYWPRRMSSTLPRQHRILCRNGGRNCGVRDSLWESVGSPSPPDRGFTQSGCQASTAPGRFSKVVLGVGKLKLGQSEVGRVIRPVGATRRATEPEKTASFDERSFTTYSAGRRYALHPPIQQPRIRLFRGLRRCSKLLLLHQPTLNCRKPSVPDVR
jgi:hypothetical protein